MLIGNWRRKLRYSISFVLTVRLLRQIKDKINDLHKNQRKTPNSRKQKKTSKIDVLIDIYRIVIPGLVMSVFSSSPTFDFYQIWLLTCSFLIRSKNHGNRIWVCPIRFLDATTHFYKRVCPSARPSVRRSVRPSVSVFLPEPKSAFFRRAAPGSRIWSRVFGLVNGAGGGGGAQTTISALVRGFVFLSKQFMDRRTDGHIPSLRCRCHSLHFIYVTILRRNQFYLPGVWNYNTDSSLSINAEDNGDSNHFTHHVDNKNNDILAHPR